MKITASEEFKSKIAKFCLLAIEAKVEVKESPSELIELISSREKDISAHLKTSEISKLEAIAYSREAYKKLGKEPARYRLSAEALMRRMVKGKGIYTINNIVEITNLISITHFYSIGTYNADKIKGDILFDIGKSTDLYESIGRGELNIENLPVFRDELGAFGNPTSDSDRTKITNKCQNMLMIIISFGGEREKLQNAGNFAIKLLHEFANAQSILTTKINY